MDGYYIKHFKIIPLTWWFSDDDLCCKTNGLCGCAVDDWGIDDPNSLKCDNWLVIAIVLSSTTVTIAHIGSTKKYVSF